MQVMDNSKADDFNVDRSDFNLTVTDMKLESDLDQSLPFEIDYQPNVDDNEISL